MGCSAASAVVGQRERQVTDALEVLANLISAITAAAGIRLADLEPRGAPAYGHLRRHGTDQRWRGRPAMVAELIA